MTQFETYFRYLGNGLALVCMAWLIGYAICALLKLWLVLLDSIAWALGVKLQMIDFMRLRKRCTCGALKESRMGRGVDAFRMFLNKLGVGG